MYIFPSQPFILSDPHLYLVLLHSPPGSRTEHHLGAQCERDLQGAAGAAETERGRDHLGQAANVPAQGHAQHRGLGEPVPSPRRRGAQGACPTLNRSAPR
jgi:hypothetical protein